MATQLLILHVFLLASALGASFAQISRKELRSKEISQDQMQSNSIDPSQVIQLSWQPRVFLYRNFLSDEECDYLISWVHRKKSHNMQVDDLPQSYLMDTDDEIARNIEDRISAWTFLPKENSKSLQVLHFGPEDSKQKYSYFHNKAAEEVGEPLLATVILYLSNVSQGGQILFPHSESVV
ncbi:probable prolyl 4-hydroxylase 12 isoform X3 [Sesamum indicum]|uniref:Probable prolyl 4-hydroxylase 12 isoform X3 n=1 Tax=Sesamum indicum TaxID=4182 RepID=A0A8M8V4G8_SESIN|nr:probable prolyl 4-hydroxylase 12 isoform X3 [Sesamum indicum]